VKESTLDLYEKYFQERQFEQLDLFQITHFSICRVCRSILQANLDEYFVPKSQIEIIKEYLEKLQKGIGYKKTADMYLFQKNTAAATT